MFIESRSLDAVRRKEYRERARASIDRWLETADKDEVADLAARLRRILPVEPGSAPAHYPELSRIYPDDLLVDDTFRGGLPDLQNGPARLIRGSQKSIQHVGISNFCLPVRYRLRDGGETQLKTSVTGTVSLAAERKGINMSRIMRTFYRHAESAFSFDVIENVLDDYLRNLDSADARIMMSYSLPASMPSLRSGLSGWQYYDIALEVVEQARVRHRVVHLDYVYSSTCPCSLELSEHARETRGQLATPHSQRSVARLSVQLVPNMSTFWPEDLIDYCRQAVPTETQVVVKREDEQAFAELNAANPIFVEDAVRLFCEALLGDRRIGDFRVAASHQESLHSHDAVSVLTEGEMFADCSLDPKLFATLHHAG